MAQHQQTGPTEASAYPYGREQEATGWVGWVLFGGILMIIVGSFNVIAGVVALFKDEYYLVAKSGLVIEMDYTAWGWWLLLWGAAVALTGLGVLVGQTWARVVGVILVAVNALMNFAFLAAYPIWTTIVIALDVIVIYALIAHGKETRALS
jgi:multisubunit Na+/H+ antiporter MnhF subunit